MPTTLGMKGDGFYDANSSGQRAALKQFLPWMIEAIPELAKRTSANDGGEAFSLLDIGSSEGGNAVYAMRRVIHQYRQQSHSPVSVYFNDLPTNDFNQLFRNLFPGGRHVFHQPDVYCGTIAGTAFGRLVPENSLSACTTFNAIGHLEKKPDTPLPNFVMPMGPSPYAPRAGVSVSDAERAPYAQQAEQDLLAFYHARAEELVSGGKLLVQVYGRDEKHHANWGPYDALNDAVLDCVEDGIVTNAYYRALVLPVYFRSMQELLDPIEHDEALSSMFRIDRAASNEAIVPFNDIYSKTADRAVWARSFCNFLRAYSEPFLAAGLADDPFKRNTLNTIYRRVEEHMLSDPDRYEFHFVSVGALLTRV